MPEIEERHGIPNVLILKGNIEAAVTVLQRSGMPSPAGMGDRAGDYLGFARDLRVTTTAVAGYVCPGRRSLLISFAVLQVLA